MQKTNILLFYEFVKKDITKTLEREISFNLVELVGGACAP